MSPMISNDKIVLSFAEFSLIEGNVIYVKFTAEGEIDEDKARGILMSTLELSKGGKHAILYDLNKLNIIFSGIAKKMAESRNVSSDNLYARAFVVYNLANKLEVNHFLKFNRPSTPTRLFTSGSDACKWVKSQE
jgi:hypothetical protein